MNRILKVMTAITLTFIMIMCTVSVNAVNYNESEVLYETDKMDPILQSKLQTMDDNDIVEVSMFFEGINEEEREKAIQEEMKEKGIKLSPESTLEEVNLYTEIERRVSAELYAIYHNKVLSELFGGYSDGYELIYLSKYVPYAQFKLKKYIVYEISLSHHITSMYFLDRTTIQDSTDGTIGTVSTEATLGTEDNTTKTEPIGSITETETVLSTEPTEPKETVTKPSEKQKNPIKVTVKTKTVKSKKLKKGKVSVKAITVKKAKGEVKYSKVSGSKKLTINKTTGKIKIKKGTKKGNYTIKVKVTAKGTKNYKPKTITKKVKIKVK